MFVCTIAVLTSCSQDNEETHFPITNCDTTNITYSKVIQPIIINSCLTCHSNNSGSGIKLEDYPDLKIYINNGSLLEAITRSVNPMPKNGNRLDDCTILKFKSWININSPNN